MVSIGIIGDYDVKRPSHRATMDALKHSAKYLSLNIAVTWLPTDALEDCDCKVLNGFAGFFCAPGSPYRSYAGALNAIRYARERDVPFIGTCGGFQHAVMEFATNALRLKDVYHEELNPEAPTFVIRALSCSLSGQTAEVILKEGSLCRDIFGEDKTEERFSCSYGMNPEFLDAFEKYGFLVAGTDLNGEARILEMPEKRFYIVTLFQPQLVSTSERPHVLLSRFLMKAAEFHKVK
jgi:CTP synthase (UTP-ammonia lyase)